MLTIGALSSCTQAKKADTSEPAKIVEKFFQTYNKGPAEAVRSLLPTNKYIYGPVSDSVAIKLQRLAAELDDFQGYEKIGEKSYGDGIVYLVYIVKYSRQPLRFNFTFYNPGNGWRIQNFRYETEFLDEMDATLRPDKL